MFQFIVIAIALLVGLLSTRLMKFLKLPNVTGYLIAGILVGPCVLGLWLSTINVGNEQTLKDIVYNQNVMTFITNAALGFIAFSIGTSFRRESLK
ncbi:MAG: cation:proton antiporter, partial [Bacilli bacterium]|nr:cation:proton antiporter [Bacilli bacterium]